MSELARRVVLSRSSLTHLADRLAAKGLLTRERVETDRRGAYAVLTDHGYEALRQAWPISAEGIPQHFAQHLTAAEIETFTTAFARLLRGEKAQADPREET
ncbi:MAG: MarR family transcriptional regulator [Chloroflexales bacterium]|nr:MarR family transcriptional regulator [Chloroflexales bacterium]